MTFPFEVAGKRKGRLPALSPLVIGQQLSGHPNFTAKTPLPSATRKIQHGHASYSGLSPAICTGEVRPRKISPYRVAGSLRAVHELILAATGKPKWKSGEERNSEIMRNVFLSLSACSLLLLTGCTLHGRLYNLDTGEVTQVKYKYSGSGRGIISGVFPSGESFKGEYVTFSHPPINWGSIYASVYGSFSGAEIHTGASMTQYGTAVGSGDRGSVVDCEYVTSSLTHGSGACKDKHGTRYKMMW